MKTLIIGLDGVPRCLLQELSDRGVMPTCRRLIEDGSLHDLAASVPEISSVSWSSFMTGADPGRHGIFGFTDLVPGSLKIRFPRFSDLAESTFWDRLGDKGRRSVVINQPSTFPARAIPGVLVSGFVALDLERAVYPAKHLGRLRQIGYVIDVDARRARADKEALLQELDDSLSAREVAVDYFWGEVEWDIFQVVVTGTDRLQHFLWDALEETDHPLHQRVLDYYHSVDSMVGRIVRRLRDDGEHGDHSNLFILSDHGFTRCRREVRLNAWLRENGYLDYNAEKRSSLECLADSTRVFALDPGRLYIRDPRDSRVRRGRDDELRDELSRRLLTLTFEGEPVIRAVHRREEIYEGPHAHLGPDLVVQTLDGFDLKGTLQGDQVFVEPSMTGMHNPDAFLLADRPLGEGLDIASVSGIIEAHYE